jgi:hypothetical protein
MTGDARDSARRLELIIRAAVAEERLLGRRLARAQDEQRRTRAQIDRELRRECWGQPPNWNQPSSER